MEELIRDIVDADRKARMKVKEKSQTRYNMQHLLEEKRAKIKEKYRQETADYIAEKREQMETDFQKAMQQEKSVYEESLQNLQDKFENHKDEWIAQIVEKTLAN